jgi:hypothetical protein
MKKILLLAVLLLVSVAAFADNDPCLASSATKQSVSLAFSTNASAVIVTGVEGKRVYVCAFTVTMSSGTTPTLLFKSGTGTTCGTGTVTYTGTMALPTASGSVVTVGAGHAMFSPTAAGADLCIATGGTTPTGNGWITYVQQ